MIFVDHKYIGLVSARLEKFAKRKENLYTFRCPYCGDSKRNKNRTRGYFYQRKSDYNFQCHNCGVSKSFTYFLKDIDQSLYDQYVLERYKEGLTGRSTNTPEPKFEFKQPVFAKKTKINLPQASENPKSSDYLKKRKLNPTKFFYAEKFKEFTNTVKHTFDDIRNDHARIIIPFYNEEKELIGFQGRSLDPWAQPKYLTVMLDEDFPKVYGLDTVNKSETVYITEGPFDSTFVQNSIAMCGSDFVLDRLLYPDCTFVYDNEPRNKEIVNRISKTIDKGDKVIIWPTSIQQKDINDMVLAGLNVMDVLKSNTYSGLEAKIKFNNWKKI
jgi:DNA primase